MKARHRIRQWVNALNLSTVVGMAVVKVRGGSLTSGPDGLVIATNVTRRFGFAGGVTIGNVVIVPEHIPLTTELFEHEAAHASQWAACVVLFLPLYWLACLWSLIRTGDYYSRNVFERRADLAKGGYVEQSTRSARRQNRPC
jgi:hypothetical protein